MKGKESKKKATKSKPRKVKEKPLIMSIDNTHEPEYRGEYTGYVNYYPNY